MTRGRRAPQLVLDEAPFAFWDEPVHLAGLDQQYAADLAEQGAHAGPRRDGDSAVRST